MMPTTFTGTRAHICAIYLGLTLGWSPGSNDPEQLRNHYYDYLGDKRRFDRLTIWRQSPKRHGGKLTVGSQMEGLTWKALRSGRNRCDGNNSYRVNLELHGLTPKPGHVCIKYAYLHQRCLCCQSRDTISGAGAGGHFGERSLLTCQAISVWT